ncbi:MAG: zeta toxin [Leptolyngbya sp. PLA3]|nr:MAG: zeta toxin [Cyanobacteria bacterium CYA]MCE7967934.1 zeta toxin [Leptolyngbya sp. PL-A3]
MSPEPPSIVILAGPNGAGKSTAAPFLIRDTLGISEFVNADVIAQGLSGFAPERSAIAAGRIMLERLRSLVGERQTFAFETTLATRSFVPWLEAARIDGYRVCLLFLHLDSPQRAIDRVKHRVRSGGHDVSPEVIVRRYHRGLNNFFCLYRSICDEWLVYDNSGAAPLPIASGGRYKSTEIVDGTVWEAVRKAHESP